MVRIIAHRGARNLWAENSLEGFRRTAALGVDAVELDLHLSSDGEIVVIHDPLLDRTTNGHGPVSGHSLEALRRLQLKDTLGETIPTLDEVLDVFAPTGLGLELEMKTDARGRPYTMTATSAVQVSPQRIDMTAPKGDVVQENGSWLMVEAQRGVFVQHAGQLDLSGDVVLYRDDGLTLRTQSTAVDMKQGAAASNEQTHAEGAFGTLDAQGFALVDKGSVVQFTGPARLVLNAAQGK